jgi:hypothetical protein
VATFAPVTATPVAVRPSPTSPQLVSSGGISADTFLWLVGISIAGILFFSLCIAFQVGPVEVR